MIDEIHDLQKQILKNLIGILKDIYINLTGQKSSENTQSFYSMTLALLEDVIRILKEENNPQQTAGTLVTIATPRIEGRCASGYHSEIFQQHSLLAYSQNENTIHRNIEKSASIALQEQIANIVRTSHFSNSHAINHYMFAAGLSSVPELTPPNDIQSAQNDILESISLSEFLSNFQRYLHPDAVVDFLKQQTPDRFDGGYLRLAATAKEFEESLIAKIKCSLQKIPDIDVDSTFSGLQSLQGPSLRPLFLEVSYNDASGNFLEAACYHVKKHLDQILPDNGICFDILSKLTSRSITDDHSTLDSELTAAIIKATPKPNGIITKEELGQWQIKRMHLQNEVHSLKEFLEFAINFHKKFKGLPPATFKVLVDLHTSYHNEIRAIADTMQREAVQDGLSINFDPRTFTYPSQAIDNARRVNYNQQDLEVSPRGLIKTLEKLNIIERTQNIPFSSL